MNNRELLARKATDSKVLKMNLEDADHATVGRMIRNECPSVSILDAFYIAKVLKEVYRYGGIRAQVVNGK